MNKKVDPIRDAYYKPAEKAESWSECLFYVTAVASIAILFLDAKAYGNTYHVAQGIFVLLAISSSILGLGITLYWRARATEKRVSDFVANAFNVSLIAEKTQFYYNNKETDPIRKAAMQLLENAFFTRNIAQKMCVRRRGLVGSYAVIWIIVAMYWTSSLDILIVVSQVIFSEQILSSLCRLEWLRSRAERIFESMFRQISLNTTVSPNFSASVIESLVCYEVIKATSNVTLSSDIFKKNNVRWSAEWDALRGSIGG